MKLAGVAAFLRALSEANVRVLVVGGLAVNAHGYIRWKTWDAPATSTMCSTCVGSRKSGANEAGRPRN